MPWIGAAIGAVGGLIGNSMNSGGQTVQNSVPPEFSGLASSWADRAAQMGNLPFNPYPYSQVADFNPYQFMGMDMGAANAMGNTLPQQAQGNLSGIMGGQVNPYMGAQTNVGTNPYSGQNPYLQGAISSALGDISNQFNMNVAPGEAANALRSGSFGNTGNVERQGQNRYDLARAMGQVEQNMRMADYGQQANLAENALNRSINAQQNDLARNSNLFQNMQTNRLQALGMAPQLNELGYSGANYLQGIGGTIQQQAQNNLNSWYDQFQQAQAWPFKTYAAMGAPFGANIGSMQTTTGASGNPVAGAIGGAMLGNKIQQGWNPSTNSLWAGVGVPTDQSGNGWY